MPQGPLSAGAGAGGQGSETGLWWAIASAEMVALLALAGALLRRRRASDWRSG